MSEEDIIQVIACVIFCCALLWLLAWAIAAYARYKMQKAIPRIRGEVEQSKSAPPQEIRDMAYQDWVDTLKEQEFMV